MLNPRRALSADQESSQGSPVMLLTLEGGAAGGIQASG